MSQGGECYLHFRDARGARVRSLHDRAFRRVVEKGPLGEGYVRHHASYYYPGIQLQLLKSVNHDSIKQGLVFQK